MQTSTIYQDRANTFALTLKKNGEILTPADMSAISKYELRYKNKYYSSTDYPGAFSVDINTATITIKPQTFGMPASRRGDVVELIIYDGGDYTEGLVWAQFKLIVKKDAALIT